MGNLLGAPVTEKETHAGVTTCGAEFGVSSMQGWRVSMEDTHIAETSLYAVEEVNGKYQKIDVPGHAIFAVFDGHGGAFAANYSGANFCRVLSHQPKFVEYAKFEAERPAKEETFASPEERSAYIQSGLAMLQEALKTSFVDIDQEIAYAMKGQKVPEADTPYHPPAEGGDAQDSSANDHAMEDEAPQSPAQDNSPSPLKLLEEEEGDSGTTACVVVLTPTRIVCANAGDSRAVLSRHGHNAVPLSHDHKPDDEPEERRIRAAGGYVAGGRVEGDLAVSRGLGDFRFKNMQVVMGDTNTMAPGDQKVSPIPDIIVQNRNSEQDEFVIVACDGIWDVVTNLECVRALGGLFAEGESDLGLICEELCDVGLARGSKDNMSLIVVKLPAQQVGTGGGVLARRQSRDAEQKTQQQEEEA